MTVWRAGRLVPLLAAVVVVLAGCSDKTPGDAQPGTETNGGTTQSTATTERSTSSAPTPGTSKLADVDPCSLLSADGVAQLGVREGYKHDVGTARGCSWEGRAPNGDLLIYDAAIRVNAGIKDLPTNKEVKKLPNIGRHEAVQTAQGGGAGTCSVIVGVTESSRVDFVGTAGTNKDKACEMATQIAKLVEPKLP